MTNVIFFKNQPLHLTVSAALFASQNLYFLHFPSLENPLSETVPGQVNNRCSNVFFDSYLIFSIVCHFLILQQCYSVLSAELILFSKQSVM